MNVKVKMHPTLGIKVASNGMVFTRKHGCSKKDPQYHWHFGWIGVQGYNYISFEGKMYKVSRLVAQTFLDNPNGFDIVDHISRDRSDDNVCNIRWCDITTNNLNKCNETGFGELSSVDRKEYMRLIHQVPKHKERSKIHNYERYHKDIEASRAKQRDYYRRKRAEGYHIILDENGKHNWVKVEAA